MLFTKAKTDFLEYLEIEQNRSQKTIRNYDHYLTRLSDYAGDIAVDEITPELIPTKVGETPQSTEASIGPYSLQDFTLFHVLRRGYRPSKIAFLAHHAWRDKDAGDWPPGYPEASRTAYDLATVRRWLEVFIKRFFANQFKRSALPNGPKVVPGGSLSPRGDWRMPSDATAATWLNELDANVPER